VLTNQELEGMVDTSDEWIRQRTGIRERRIIADGESTSDLAARAATLALERAELDPTEIDAIILGTISPDTYCPAGAVYVQQKIGATNACAFDISAACTGFVYATTIASSFIRSGLYENVLVIGAEALSRFIDFTDRNTCILFGDGAGAAVISRAPEASESRILDHYLRTDGSGSDLIIMPGGGSRQPATHDTVEAKLHYLTMQGREVFKFATRTMLELLDTACKRNEVELSDIDLIIPHQVNSRIIEAVLRKIAIPEDRLFLNLDRYGNTSAASVPIALHEAVEAGKLERGKLVLLVAFGAGLTWGYNLIRW
jgi:3-oxoacyl-[acyl-carrier-protein] synthase-3